MLLTSAQVSFAISSVIGIYSRITMSYITNLTFLAVFFFTSALFLSGYVLQQQTVRDLRAAIKPQLVRLPSGPDFFPAPKLRDDGFLVDTVVIEGEKREAIENGNVQGNQEEDDMIGATRWQKAARRKKFTEAAVLNDQKPLLEDQDTQMDEEIIKSTSKTATTEEEKPLSRAARRKQIKDQILADGNGESFKGYRRRMWWWLDIWIEWNNIGFLWSLGSTAGTIFRRRNETMIFV